MHAGAAEVEVELLKILDIELLEVTASTQGSRYYECKELTPACSDLCHLHLEIYKAAVRVAVKLMQLGETLNFDCLISNSWDLASAPWGPVHMVE